MIKQNKTTVETQCIAFPYTCIASLFFMLLSMPFGMLNAQNQDFPPCSKEFLCLEYDSILSRTLDYIKKEDGEAAFTEYKALEACDKCPEHRDGIEKLSDEIIGIFRKKNTALERAKKDVARERDQQELLRLQTAKMAHEASIENYIFQAHEYLESGEVEEAYWLTDFVYTYLDSTHYGVKKMMHKLYHKKFLPDNFMEIDLEEELQPEPMLMTGVEWSNNEEWLAIGGGNGQLVIFDALGQVVTDTFIFQNGETITDVSFNSNSNLLAVSSSEGKIRFYELTYDREWIESSSTLNNSIGILSLSWSPTNPNLLAFAGVDQLLHVHNFDEEEDDIVFPAIHEDWVRDVDWSPTGDRLVSGDDFGRVIIWSLAQQKALHIMEGHTDYVRTVDWHPNGHEIMTGSDDNQLIFWDTTGTQIRTKTYNGWIYQARYSESGDKIGIVVDQSTFGLLTDNSEEFQQIPSGVAYFDWKGEQHTYCCENNEKGTPLKIGWSDAPETPFTVPFSQEEEELDNGVPPIEEGGINEVAWSPDGQFLAYYKENELIVISEDSIQRMGFTYENIIGISWHPGLSSLLKASNFLATIDENRRIRVWDAHNLQLIETLVLADQMVSIDWSPNGKLLAAGDQNGNLHLFSWEGQKLELLRSANFHSGRVPSVAWSPNGKYIATASYDKTGIIYEPGTDLIIDRLEGHIDWVRSVCWISDTRLATAGDDQKTIVWDKGDGGGFSIKQELVYPSTYHMKVAYNGSKDRGTLVTYNDGRELIFWHVDRDQITQDTVVALEETINDFSWHPTNNELTYARYGRFPISIRTNRDFQTSEAYDPLGKPSSIQFSDEVSTFDKQSNLFFDQELQIEPGQFSHLQESSDESLIACISKPKLDGQSIVTLYDADSEERLYIIKSEGDINRIRFSPDNNYLADASNQGFIGIREARSGANPTIVARIGTPVYDMSWSPNSQFFVFLKESNQLGVWNNETKELVASVDCPEGGFKLLFYPSNSEQLLLLNDENLLGLNLNRIDKGFKVLYEASPNENTNMQWCDNGKRLFLSQTQGEAVTFSYKNGQLSEGERLNFKGDLFTSLSPQGSLLCNYSMLDATSTAFKREDRQLVRIRNMHTLLPLRSIQGIRNRLVVDMAISPDDQYLATWGYELDLDQGSYFKGNAVIDIWDIEEAKSIFELQADNVQKIAFSPQGKHLIVYKNDGQVLFIPMHVPSIQTNLFLADKDAFFQQNLLEETNPILDFIELCGLDQGLNLNLEPNLQKLSERESFEVRSGWSEYMVEKAWAKSGNIASEFFNHAINLHQQRNSDKVKANQQDSLALSDIYYDQAMYFLRLGQYKPMTTSLDKATRLAPNNIRIEFFHVLLDWQKGLYKKSFKKIVAFISSDDYRLISRLQEEYLAWQRKDIDLKDEVRFFRILSNDRQLKRYTNVHIDILEAPRMADLVADFDIESRKEYLFQYYKINRDHADLEGDDRKYEFYSDAIQFLEEYYDENNFEAETIEDYTGYLYQMMTIEARKGDMKRARLLAEKALAASRLWLEKAPDDTTAKQRYVFIFGELSVFELVTGEDAEAVRGRLYTVLNKTDSQFKIMLIMRLGHSELFLGNDVKAYEWYNRALKDKEYSTNLDEGQQVVDFIANELDHLLPHLADSIRVNLEDLNDMNFYIIDSQNTSQEILNTSSEESYLFISEQKNRALTERLAKAVSLHQKSVMPESDLEYIRLQTGKANAQYAYNLMLFALSEGEVSYVEQSHVIDSLLQSAVNLHSEQTWIEAIYVLHLLLQDDWKKAEKILRSINNYSVQFPTKETPTIEAYLLDPPSEIKLYPNYKKNEKKLKAFFEMR